MTIEQIEAELSYAYLHAVASRAGVICERANTLADGQGVDARLQIPENLASELSDNGIVATIDVSLKSTCQPLTCVDGSFRYALKVLDYNRLCRTSRGQPFILVVLLLPEDPEAWLTHSEEMLVARTCAFWQSFRGLPETANTYKITVDLPRANALSVEGLRALLSRVSKGDLIAHAG